MTTITLDLLDLIVVGLAISFTSFMMAVCSERRGATNHMTWGIASLFAFIFLLGMLCDQGFHLFR